MADISTRYHEQTLLIEISRTAATGLDADVFVSGVEILNEAERDAEVRSILLTGDTAGLGHMGVAETAAMPLPLHAAWLEGLHSLVESLMTFPKPTLALLQGQVSGSGLALALACDMVVAAPSARIVLQGEGVHATPGGLSWHMARRLPRGLAMQLLAGEMVETDRLYTCGAISHLSTAGDPVQSTLALAAHLHRWPAMQWLQKKDLLQQAATHDFYQQLQQERTAALKQPR